MKLKTMQGVFVRHCRRESIMWRPRYDGCVVLRECEQLLKELGDDWRDEDEIISSVAAKFRCTVESIREDLKTIIDELVLQGFVSCDTGGSLEAVDVSVSDRNDISDDSSMRLFSDFCARHEIPAELHIDLTDACTELCVHCYVPRGKSHYLPFALAEKVLREFRSVNGFTVHITGGEPMLHPDFERICRLCLSLDLNLVVFSNMTLCDDSRIAFLREVNPQFVNVSVYSMNEKEHDAITGVNGSWRRTIDAVLKCCTEGVHCRIATPLLKENKNALPDLKRFADRHQMYFVPNCEIVAQADHICANLLHACSAEEVREVLLRDHSYFQHVPDDGRMPSADAKVCDIGEGRLYVNAKGEYYPCDSMHEYVLGSICKNTLDEIWGGEGIKYLRSLKNRDFGACVECARRPWCKVCPAANYNATGDLFRHHPSACVLAGVMQDIYGRKE